MQLLELFLGPLPRATGQIEMDMDEHLGNFLGPNLPLLLESVYFYIYIYLCIDDMKDFTLQPCEY